MEDRGKLTMISEEEIWTSDTRIVAINKIDRGLEKDWRKVSCFRDNRSKRTEETAKFSSQRLSQKKEAGKNSVASSHTEAR